MTGLHDLLAGMPIQVHLPIGNDLPAELYEPDKDEVGGCPCACCGVPVDDTAWTTYTDLETRAARSVCGDCNELMTFLAFNSPELVSEMLRRRGITPRQDPSGVGTD